MRRIWVLTGGKSGDDGQARAVAHTLGGTVEEKSVRWNCLRLLPNWLVGAHLMGFDHRRSSVLRPPWPDLVLGVGRRSVRAALWIRRQSANQAKIIQLGRPRAPLSWFDLVITTPQYQLPCEPNVVMARLPFASATSSPDDTEHWSKRWAGLARPLTGVLIGGSTYPYRLTQNTLAQIIDQSQAISSSGTLVVVASPRTGAVATNQLARLVWQPHEFHPWSGSAPNPYRSLLQVADRFVVTEDSASMLAEAASTGKPVSVVFLPRLPLPAWSAASGVMRFLARSGVLSPPRNLRLLVLAMIAAGKATPLPDMPAPRMVISPPRCEDWEVILTRARRLLGSAAETSRDKANH
jgi:mitochondrial fission protein ELM1